MMAQYPATDGDEVATKSFLRAEISDLRTDLRSEISDLRTDLHDELRTQTKWMTGVVITSLFGGLAASAAITQAFT